MPTQTFVSVIYRCRQITHGIGIGTQYRYSVSVSERAKSIGIGSIGKLWYRSHPTFTRSQLTLNTSQMHLFQSRFVAKLHRTEELSVVIRV